MLALINLANGFAAEIDLDSRILAISDSAAALLDLPPEFLTNQRFFDLVHLEDVEHVQNGLAQCLMQNDPVTATVRVLKGVAEQVWLDLKIIACHDEGPAPTFAVWGQDITEQKANQERLRDLALHDPLTGLGNRMMLEEHIARAISNGEKCGTQFTVALLDLDGFKRVNDSLGHGVGDELLISAAQRLTNVLHKEDSVIRMGGDEFIIILNGAFNTERLRVIARHMLAAIERPFKVQSKFLYITTSIGMAIYPDHGASKTELLKNSDLAMYQAKGSGKNTFVIFDKTMADHQAMALSLESDMIEGFGNGEFCLHYQPICDAADNTVRGVEALMRWTRDGEMIPPAKFIPLAEQSTFINLLGEWALRTACMQLADWEARGIHVDYMAVNVSPKQFMSPLFYKAVKQALDASRISGDRLMLEITESTLATNPMHAIEVMDELRQLGVRFAVDDFGTGYSSLSYLKSFPLSVLKIDHSFIRDLPTSKSDQKIVSAVLGLARELELETVGEGIEVEEHLMILRDKGCTAVQGYLISKPVPARELEEKIATKALTLVKA